MVEDNMNKYSQIFIALCFVVLSTTSHAEQQNVIVHPQASALLPISPSSAKTHPIVCRLINNSFPSSVAIALKSATDRRVKFHAKINGNPLSHNRGYLTRRDNDLVIQVPHNGWANPVRIYNMDIDIAIQVAYCKH